MVQLGLIANFKHNILRQDVTTVPMKQTGCMKIVPGKPSITKQNIFSVPKNNPSLTLYNDGLTDEKVDYYEFHNLL